MISQRELQRKADLENIPLTQIEKDYVLTWVLSGIAQDAILKDFLLFKGGTLLKKCYFEDYRFSEDLDFTAHKSDSLSEQDIKDGFLRVRDFVKQESQNQLSLIGEIVPNNLKNISFEMGYVSVLGGIGSNKKIKVDISMSEKMITPPIKKGIFHTYSDQIKSELQCYSLEEVLSEKMCALMSREQPRDLFDLWYLLEIHGMNITDSYNSFSLKAQHRNLNPTNFLDKIDKRLPSLERRWTDSLQEQIEELPKIDSVLRELGRHFRILKEYEEKQKVHQYRPSFASKQKPKKRGFRL